MEFLTFPPLYASGCCGSNWATLSIVDVDVGEAGNEFRLSAKLLVSPWTSRWWYMDARMFCI